MIQCSHCGTQNRDGSKFCSDCGARLVQQSGLVCPMCGEPNTVENVFCKKCGARLAPLTVAPPAEKTPTPSPIKGLSLPAKPAEPAAPIAKAELTKPVEPVVPAAEAEPAAPTAKAELEKPAPPDERKSDDWLARLRALPPEEEAPSPTSAPIPASEESGDWLARLRAAPSVEQAAPTEPTLSPTDAVEVAEEDLPDWLRSSPAPTAQEPAPAPTDATPGWMDQRQTEAEQAAPATTDETPGWMTQLRAEAEQAAPAPTSGSDDDIPDWLKDAGASPAAEQTASSIQELGWSKVVISEPQAPPPVPATEAEIPDWLKTLKPKTEELGAPVAPVDEAAPVDAGRRSVVSPGEELLESLEATVPAPVPTDAAEPAWLTETPREVSEEEYLPDWLRTPVAGAPVQAETLAEGAPTTEPAEVPDWIAALKPVDQPAPGVFASGPVEASGPLAGLRGLLPLAAAIVEPHAPPKPAPPSPFKETAHIFESILAAPAGASAAPVAKPAHRAWTMRPFIYMLMALAVLLPFFVPDIANPSLRTFGTPAENFYNTIQNLQPNSVVVVSFDYDPGSAGEMDLLANAIVPHLMGQHTKIIAMSTSETGAQIAQRVLDTAARGKPEYKYGTNYVNFYLPGSEAGLSLLATDGFTNFKDWNQKQTLDKFTGFASVRTLPNVKLVIELAGAIEPLQMWVEQVQMRAGTPIAAGVSAAVEPRARAYRDAKQLVALLSGPLGAAQYETLSGQRGQAVISAGAQSTAQLVLIGLIVLGNLVYWFSRGRSKAK